MGNINSKGRDWGSVVNFDDLGKVYAAVAIVWTVVLSAGMAWLISHRHLSYLRMRNIPLAIAATATLHVYLVKILLAYTVNGHFSCDAEFWIMNIYLPMGIALFQANMVQLQSISGQQQKLLEGLRFALQAEKPLRRPGFRGLWMKWRSMSAAKRAELLIAAGMVLQLLVTTAIYLASRKFHRSWGFGVADPKPAMCRKGWEWIPSTIWQLVFSWFYGPCVLYKIRNINDVHYWRLQITICVIAGLPGSPLWLASLYSTQFRLVNRFWVPPMCTLDIVKSWEDKRQRDESATDSGSSRHDSFYGGNKFTYTSTIASRRRREMYTMAHLDKALVINATPLLNFAATKEFTGENIVFLTQVRDWRGAWNRAQRNFGTITGQSRRYLFNLAVEIFVLSISTKTAHFPVNIEGKIRSDLEAVFGPAVLDVEQDRDNNVVDPFNHPSSREMGLVSAKAFETKGAPHVTVAEYNNSDHALSETEEPVLPYVGVLNLDASLCVPESVAIPVSFDEHVFDEAEQSVKYMVLTNTWPKFVDSRKEHGRSVGGKAASVKWQDRRCWARLGEQRRRRRLGLWSRRG
ncbi:hypothetical protein LTR16_001603 [Cryomyces antarcticus]|uniref:Integral membrane protein n=1 Tax=Cryomyces antarcticus TaxID=329879 RepID=A0ABR0LQ59_9PEZI|nr:hypothetical protein LTR39_001041 [Cryomyces antarcticus]KAK5201746.1 hypothetical protein LTR16_001603 [Cryomyces antarcticus]